MPSALQVNSAESATQPSPGRRPRSGRSPGLQSKQQKPCKGGTECLHRPYRARWKPVPNPGFRSPLSRPPLPWASLPRTFGALHCIDFNFGIEVKRERPQYFQVNSAESATQPSPGRRPRSGRSPGLQSKQQKPCKGGTECLHRPYRARWKPVPNPGFRSPLSRPPSPWASLPRTFGALHCIDFNFGIEVKRGTSQIFIGYPIRQVRDQISNMFGWFLDLEGYRL